MIKVFIVDDHEMFREGLRTLLLAQGGFIILGEASTGIDAIHKVQELKPNIVLMDINISNLNGIEATRQILSDSADIKILALSMLSDQQSVQEMLKAGASGYVLKGSAFTELLEAIKTVMSGHHYLSPQISEMFMDDYIGHLDSMHVDKEKALTMRERQVLQLLAEGNTNSQIASLLCINVNTVDTHKMHISEKLGLHGIAALTKYAINNGIISLVGVSSLENRSK